MNVEFWGAARTVTGSMHLVHWRGRRVLLDCGLYQGSRKQAFRINRELPFDTAAVDAVVLSHAHIDHSGNLPSLVRAGFRGPILTSLATRDLADIMLADSAKIQESDVEYVNRRRARQGETPFEPLYTIRDVDPCLQLFRPIEFGEWSPVTPHIRVRLHVAGHMLGAASVELELERVGGEPVRLVFSGDIGRRNVPILPDPQTVAGANFLIMEATYGNRLHPPDQDVKQVLARLIREAHATGGKLIIPAFSVGRTQELVYHLNELHAAQQLPPIPIFVDSPLAVDATQVFRRHRESYDEEATARLLADEDGDPLSFQNLYYIRRAEYSKKLNTFAKPAVIISASGMCESGRVLHHLKNHVGQPNTTVLFAGFQAANTLGRRLLEGARRVSIFGDEFDVRAKMVRLEAASGHADQRELLEWARTTADPGALRQVALVHSDLDVAQVFAELLREAGIGPVAIPARGQSLPLNESPGSA